MNAEKVLNALAVLLGVPRSRLEWRRSLYEQGMDSIRAYMFFDQLRAMGGQLDLTQFHEDTTLVELFEVLGLEPVSPAEAEFYKRDAESTLVAVGRLHTIRRRLAEREAILEEVNTALREPGGAGLVLGALPFSQHAEVDLFSPRDWISVVSPTRFDPTPTPHRQSTPPPSSSRNGFERLVHEALREIREGHLAKVVAARREKLEIGRTLDRGALLRALGEVHPTFYTFGMHLKGGWWVGSTPERLLRKQGSAIISHPLAGTALREPGVSGAEAALLRSSKCLREHAAVVEFIADTLTPYCTDLQVPKSPLIVNTPHLSHLGTPLTGVLRDPQVSSLELTLALHPTPAVCGTPTEAAREFLQEAESFDREFYAGATGWVDVSGDGDWWVMIRCGVFREAEMTLYSGAGIVAGSVPAEEWQETEWKLGAMIQALQTAQEVPHVAAE